jgi:hypothetical protein
MTNARVVFRPLPAPVLVVASRERDGVLVIADDAVDPARLGAAVAALVGYAPSLAGPLSSLSAADPR